ncbi:MAG: deoxyribose-phosphate aldolase [Tissierellia bacterium]|nr:deoxyribose-phosphate aldolase [Tissierellia bacterium]
MDINMYIDHTLLKADATEDKILELCDDAIEYKFKAVCVNPYWVRLCKEKLINSDVLVATVIGFPLGANTSKIKALETEDAIVNGANEIDMVINIGELKNGNYEAVLNDIKAVVEAAKDKAIVKVIIETALLNDEEIVKACELAKDAGANFVKTSTGFSTSGAKLEDVRLMKNTVGDELEVKASGGVSDIDTAIEMIKAGATRIGTSAGVKLSSEFAERLKGE